MEWTGPPSLASRSMSTTPGSPENVRTVMRAGRPNVWSPVERTAMPLTWPTAAPSVAMSSVPSAIIRPTRSSTRFERYVFSAMA